MRLIGLCGRSGSGKGVFCAVAAQNGIKIIDCDSVYKDLVSKPSACLLEIAEAFGGEVIKDSALNRRYLAPIVFSNPEKLTLLNSIAHKHILSEIENILSSCDQSDIILLDAPTLFESGIDSKCELVIGVIASDEICISRITARDKISESEARARLKNQLSENFIIENCDYIIYNDSTAADFESAVCKLVDSLKEGSV